jgi:hypothetical protein
VFVSDADLFSSDWIITDLVLSLSPKNKKKKMTNVALFDYSMLDFTQLHYKINLPVQ